MTQRILQGAPATLTYDHLDADGSAVSAGGTMTVAVATADGTTVLAAGTATSSSSTGRYTVALTRAQTAELDVLTATWTDSAEPTAARTTEHEVVGSYLFSIDELRAFGPGLASVAEYPTADIIAARNDVEVEVEDICDVAFVPRYRRVTLDGTGDVSIVTGVHRIRTVRSVRILSSAGSSSYTSLSAAALAGLVWTRDGLLRRTDGDTFPSGHGLVVVELEHGYTVPPGPLRQAVMERCQDWLFNPGSGVPARARSYQAADGFAYDLAPPDEWSTGMPTVDAVYIRYSERRRAGGSAGGGADRPASRPLDYDPQWWGLYRGGRS